MLVLTHQENNKGKVEHGRKKKPRDLHIPGYTETF